MSEKIHVGDLGRDVRCIFISDHITQEEFEHPALFLRLGLP